MVKEGIKVDLLILGYLNNVKVLKIPLIVSLLSVELRDYVSSVEGTMA